MLGVRKTNIERYSEIVEPRQHVSLDNDQNTLQTSFVFQGPKEQNRFSP